MTTKLYLKSKLIRCINNTEKYDTVNQLNVVLKYPPSISFGADA